MSVEELMADLKASEGSAELDSRMQAALEPDRHAAGVFPPDCTTNLVAAIQMLKRVFPGWSWRVAECSVSDDAWLAPDFNCPRHGEGLRGMYSQAFDWAGMTDVDLRPSGRVPVALCMSMLKARQLTESGLHGAGT